MATVKIDLAKIAPEISEKIDEIRKKADELQSLSRSLYMALGYELEIECDLEKKQSGADTPHPNV